MSLEYAILGFLNYLPLSGYDLKKIFDTSVQHFWPADQSQIYRTLARLTEDGFVEMDIVHQEDHPDRKVYHITTPGQQHLQAWLKSTPPSEPNRSASLIQVFFCGQLSNQEILAKFEAVAAMMRVILERYQRIPSQLEEYNQMIHSERESYFWLLTLDLGLRSMRANLAWAENVIEEFKQGKVPEK
ncbi:MAG: PadR family transcriptional regulator [Anaerolineales bacterium]